MRGHVPKILLLAFMLVTDAALFAPAAEATTHRVKAVAVSRPVAVSHPVAAARVSGHAKVETKSEKKKVTARELEKPVSRHGLKIERIFSKTEPKSRRGVKEVHEEREVSRSSRSRGRERDMPVLTRVHGHFVEIAPERGKSSRRPPPSLMIPEESRYRAPAPLRAEALPAPDLAPLPEIHVNHNRKEHHEAAPESAMPAAAVEPRKATSADFMAPNPPAAAPAHQEIHETGVSHPDDGEETGPRAETFDSKEDAEPAIAAAIVRVAPPVAKPVSVVSVMRPAAAPRPQLPSMKEEALEPLILPSLYNNRGRLVMPPPLKGSREILLHQNEVADREGLDRIQDDEDLRHMREARILVALPENETIYTDDRLPANRRYARPWTAQFLSTMARAHYARFHTPIQVNSAVRTVEFQQHLLRVNGNAAPAMGDTASPHLTGQAIDLAKRGLSTTEVAWMRGYLLPLVQEGKIDVEEEFQQSCFHISVYKKYLPPATPSNRNIPGVRRNTATALATAIR